MRELVVFVEFEMDMYSEYSQQSTELKEELEGLQCIYRLWIDR